MDVGSHIVTIQSILELVARGKYHYPKSTKKVTINDVVVWSFVVVTKGSQVLTYRHGQYREESDKFRRLRGIGFFAPVLEGDRTLFDLNDHGIIKRGLSTISIDLGLTTSIDLAIQGEELAHLECFVKYDDERKTSLLSVIHFVSPDWFEPYAKRLAINDLRWIDFSNIPHALAELDPWSAVVFQEAHAIFSPRMSKGG